MTHVRAIRAIAAAGLLLVSPAGAQSTGVPGASVLQRADSAWASGDRRRARALYAEVLAHDSTQSRAVFRLAQLDESEQRSLALYRRYIMLEPGDAWGHMAEGDLLARMGHWEDGLVAYAGASAIAPGERDVALGRARLLERAGRSNDAAAELAAWTTRHPDDGEAWDLLGRSQMRSGRPRAAAGAFENALHRGVPGAALRLNGARAASAPSVTPEAAVLIDSDGNRSTRFGGSFDLMLMDGVRLGGGLQRHITANDIDQEQGTDILARLSARMAPGVSASIEGGAIQFDEAGRPALLPPPARRPGESWTAVHMSARLRARTAGSHGASLDLRAERVPLAFSPLLISNRVTRSEARAVVDVPLAGMRLRGSGRVGRFEAPGEPANGRVGAEGALVLPLGLVQPSLQYRLIGFERASAAGYFAPRRAETAEAGLYFDSGDETRLSIATDLGAGAQRVMDQGGGERRWSPAWRAWGQATLAIGPSRFWYVEVEAYDAAFAPEGVATAGHWRSLSVASGLRWSMR
jgi:hypothetical protein